MPPPASYALDGLWRCLCPSIDAIFLARAPQCLPRLSSDARRSYGYRTVRHTRRLHTGFQPAGAPAPNVNGTTSTGENVWRVLGDRIKPVALPEVVDLAAREPSRKLSVLSDDPAMHCSIGMLEDIVKSHWDTTGSALALEEALDRIDETVLQPGSSFYHAALRVCWTSRWWSNQRLLMNSLI
jgi:hypothetical protein